MENLRDTTKYLVGTGIVLAVLNHFIPHFPKLVLYFVLCYGNEIRVVMLCFVLATLIAKAKVAKLKIEKGE